MKAAVLHGKEQVRVEEVPLRPPQAGEVQVRIEAALTCGTDVKVYRRGYHARMIVPPAVFGHEFAGVISELGASVTGWSVGDRVAVANSAPCGACYFCKHGQENLCEDLQFLNGAYAEFITVPDRLVRKNMLRLKDSTGFPDAALVEPLACVVHGVEDSGLQAGQNVLILGSGPIGLMFATLARHLGCQVTLAGRGRVRLEAAARLGAGRVIDVTNQPDLMASIAGRGWPLFDVVIEAVGKPEVWQTALRLVRKGGAVNFFGGCAAGTSVALDTALMHYSSLTLKASFHHTPHTVRRALELIETGVVRATDFVDGDCPLGELPDLFRQMAAGNHAVKTLIHVHE
jgi:L-iditol 2-dehydrogenase